MSVRNPYLFVIGAPRSGTTLLERILDAHPEHTVLSEANFIPLAPGVGPGSDPELTHELVEWVRKRRRATVRDAMGGRLRSLQLDHEHIDAAAASSTRWSEFVAALYDQVGARAGTALVGQKQPAYIQHIPVLHELFPDARFIHLTRDGRDVALSMLEWAADKKPARTSLWAERPIAYCALQWTTMVLTGLRDGFVLPEGRIMQLRYEDLIARPEETALSLCVFLDLPDAVDDMLAFHVGRRRAEPSLSIKDSWAPLTAGVRDWRYTLSDEDCGLFEAIAREPLIRLGYPLTTVVTEKLADQADRCLSWWHDGRPDRPVLEA